jgi:hypothetical protein
VISGSGYGEAVVIWDVSLSFLVCVVVMHGNDACGSSGGGDFVEVVALRGVVMVWFGRVMVDYL